MPRPEYVNVNMGAALKERFRKACESNYTSMSEELKRAALEYVKLHEAGLN